MIYGNNLNYKTDLVLLAAHSLILLFDITRHMQCVQPLQLFHLSYHHHIQYDEYDDDMTSEKVDLVVRTAGQGVTKYRIGHCTRSHECFSIASLLASTSTWPLPVSLASMSLPWL